MGEPAPPGRRRDIKLTDKELAVLQAIEDLGENARIGDIQKRANEILRRKKQN